MTNLPDHLFLTGPMAINTRALILGSLLLLSAASYGQSKNGFDLTDSLVPANEIRSGGLPPDEIPSIDEPTFVAAEDASFLRDRDRVIGVSRNGIAKAYWIGILEWHEIVNDVFGDEAVLISYCPLCNTGMVFSVKNPNVRFTFGVSGLLYNSDLLLYDRQTNSLWSQIMGQAIAGPLKGVTMKLLPSSHTTWRDWRDRYPDTLVLTNRLGLGYGAFYRDQPYRDYARSGRLYYGVNDKNDEFRNKELVLGISIGKEHKAYPFSELSEHGLSSFEDEFAGRRVTVEWIESEDTGRVFTQDGTELPSVLAYWFAWYAFHPDTEIFRADN